ncbi:hypothetical protein IFM89_016337 [Coptis chinensis]|uniref:Uncharacterized protein n=1 Tax=Coptis chinensis TaxID=261450 RepID=A0A835HC61_9MAGN|nr:hypothetical protein IFM89_016337 [Coptis chinensis]
MWGVFKPDNADFYHMFIEFERDVAELVDSVGTVVPTPPDFPPQKASEEFHLSQELSPQRPSKKKKKRSKRGKCKEKLVLIDEDDGEFFANLYSNTFECFDEDCDGELALLFGHAKSMTIPPPLFMNEAAAPEVIVDEIEEDEGYRSTHSCEDEMEFQMPQCCEEFFEFVSGTTNMSCKGLPASGTAQSRDKPAKGKEKAVTEEEHVTMPPTTKRSKKITEPAKKAITPAKKAKVTTPSKIATTSGKKATTPVKKAKATTPVKKVTSPGKIATSVGKKAKATSPSKKAKATSPVKKATSPGKKATIYLSLPQTVVSDPPIHPSLPQTVVSDPPLPPTKRSKKTKEAGYKKATVFSDPLLVSTISTPPPLLERNTFMAPQHRHTMRDLIDKQTTKTSLMFKSPPTSLKGPATKAFKPPGPSKKKRRGVIEE